MAVLLGGPGVRLVASIPIRSRAVCHGSKAHVRSAVVADFFQHERHFMLEVQLLTGCAASAVRQ